MATEVGDINLDWGSVVSKENKTSNKNSSSITTQMRLRPIWVFLFFFENAKGQMFSWKKLETQKRSRGKMLINQFINQAFFIRKKKQKGKTPVNFGVFFHDFKRAYALSFEMLAAHQRWGGNAFNIIFFCFVRFTKECRLKVSLWICVYGIWRVIGFLGFIDYIRLMKVNQSCCCLLMAIDFAENVHQLWRWFLSGQRIIFRQAKCVKWCMRR